MTKTTKTTETTESNTGVDLDFVSRRSFLKGAALTAAVGIPVALSGCSSGTPAGGGEEGTGAGVGEGAGASGIAWDYEADIVVVGAGGAGLSCAIEATDLGVSVIVLESQPYVGGSSALCNGGIAMPGTPLQKEQGIEDSPELFYQDLSVMTQVDNNLDWLKMHCEEAAGLWDWLTGMGLEFKKESLLPTQGASVPREHHIVPTTVIATLEERATSQGADIRTETTAFELVRDVETKRVIGVKARDAGGREAAYKANGGVLLATNGYSRDIDMLNQYVFGQGADSIICFTGMGDLGQGHKMAMALGADTRHIGFISLLTGQNPDGTAGDSCSLFHGGAILVNQDGKRFVDESLGYGNVWPDVVAQPGGICYQIWDEDIAVEYAKNDSSLYSMEKIEATGLLLKADTIEGIAELIGAPADALAATMERYNSDISATGRDSEFGRAHKVSQVDTPPVLDTPPFYAWKTGNVLYGTSGGIKHNLDMQVVDLNGEVIEGLYLAGTICTYSNMGVVPSTIKSVGASGTGFGGSMIWGRFTARRIKELELSA